MSQSVITFDHVWKKFQRGESHNSLRDLVPAIATRLFRPPPSTELQAEQFWAVQDVSFEVKRGEALGIIGPNGAGKSTTLKLLTRIMRPTRGTCSIKGRTGALIEVAAGFHPDLTGRENVFLQGAIMGMKRADIVRKLDAIVDFSGLHDFIDTQVKRYSSGMNARLGFSIAANLEPDSLVIDEVLAVGDMAFQQRCIDRMEDFKRQGVAIVFVSHNLQAVSSLCTQALFLSGTTRAFGHPDDVIRAYVASADAESEAGKNDRIQIRSSKLFDALDQPVVSTVEPGTELTLRVACVPKVSARDVTFEFMVYRSTDNLLAYNGHFTNADIGLERISAGEEFEVDFRLRANLTRGHYRAVIRIYDNIIQEFHAQVCPPATLVIEESRTWAGIAFLDVRPAARVTTGTAQGFAEHRS
jgi:ABC-type polysaccharide/polyol phosphate transport system ATPase subunit